MSEGLDLTAAVEAGRVARKVAYFDGLSADACSEAAVLATVPLIEAAVREQVAREIEAEQGAHFTEYGDEEPVLRGYDRAMTKASRIARGPKL